MDHDELDFDRLKEALDRAVESAKILDEFGWWEAADEIRDWVGWVREHEPGVWDDRQLPDVAEAE